MGRFHSIKNKKDMLFAAGFTLLEVLVALTLLATALLMISRLFSHNLRSIAASGDYSAAIAAAQEKLQDVLESDTLAEGATHETIDDIYQVDTSVHQVLADRTENLNLKLFEVDLTVNWPEAGKTKTCKLTTLKMIGSHP
ncbi:MAG: prepilin-type N-terminal cleavage/methylation domain-containing protein [Nitrospiraceae bacterium]|nr:prepilin-type N-terminal cleavage/methylation domain-containing protein [Nitrospiraceae bacterium]